MKTTTKLMTALTTALLLLSTVVCGDAVDAVENSYNCAKVCDRYRDCFDSDYDAETCAQNCENTASDDTEYANTVNSCEACIDDRSCSESVFPCASECGSVVP